MSIADVPLNSLDQALSRLAALHPKLIDLSLERMLRVCEALGNPQDRLGTIVHVAGTNAKGSVIAMLRAMAEAQGLRVHAYTSPHLVHFRERIRLGGKLIDDERLIDALARVEAANQGAPLTFFEATTAAAFLAMSETPSDLVLLETGLGGILDATNIIAKPRLCVITPIDFDHLDFLGTDLTTIAKQKAGIIKPNVMTLSASQQDEARAVLVRQAMKMSAPISFCREGWGADQEADRLIFHDEDALLDLSLPALHGAHQIENAGLAIKAVLYLGLEANAIDQGLRRVEWPARLQRLTKGPLFAALPDRASELWLDGAHNPHAALALRAHIDALQTRDPKPLTIICGLLDTKDLSGFMTPFAHLRADWICVDFNAPRAQSSHHLWTQAKDLGLMADRADSLMQAMSMLKAPASRVVICGSLYLAGEALGLSPETWPQ